MRVRKGGGHIRVEYGRERDFDNKGGGRVGSEKKEFWNKKGESAGLNSPVLPGRFISDLADFQSRR